MTKNIYIVGYKRTPIASFQGPLASLASHELGAVAIRGALQTTAERASKDPTAFFNQVGQVWMGQVLQAGAGQAPGRQAMIRAGIPNSVPAVTVNKVCGSGMQAVISGYQSIALGDVELAVTGGMESMSQAPYFMPQARAGFRMGHGKVLDAMIHDGLWDPYQNRHMGMCGEICAKEYGFTREMQDKYATRSFERAQKAQKAGQFEEEIEPVTIEGKKGDSIIVREDDGPNKVVFDKMGKLKPAFDPAGTITAANASTINDGAAALVLASEDFVKRNNLKPIARIVSYGSHAQDPQWFTTAPIDAMKRAAQRANWKMGEIDRFEVNEAFAVVAMAAQKGLEIPDDRLNVRGGAISLGHPIGASGARILITLAQTLKQEKLKKGMAGICIGGGEALALCLEMLD